MRRAWLCAWIGHAYEHWWEDDEYMCRRCMHVMTEDERLQNWGL